MKRKEPELFGRLSFYLEIDPDPDLDGYDICVRLPLCHDLDDAKRELSASKFKQWKATKIYITGYSSIKGTKLVELSRERGKKIEVRYPEWLQKKQGTST